MLKIFSVNMFIVLYFVVLFPFFVVSAEASITDSACEDTVPDCDTYDKNDICTGVSKMYGAVNCRKTCDHCNECNRGFYRNNGVCTACNYWCNVNVSSTLSVCRENDGFCEFGRYGYKCGLRCSSTCKDVCDRVNGSCSTGCIYPSYCGSTCALVCNDGCASQACNQSCDCVHGCIPNRWGKQCREFCSSTCNRPQNISLNTCDITNGACIHGCVNNSYWGSHCEHQCSSNCLSGTCNSISGNCTTGCINTQVYEGNCSLSCSQYCYNLTCARETGYCEYGCKPGWYGKTCNLQCSDHCFDKRCSQRDGTCVSGCQNGWYGPSCTQQCGITCKNRVCFVDTGNCSQGCVHGFQGPHCEKALQRSRMCFGCDDMSSPLYCDSVLHCKINEVCFLESHLLGHGTIFRSGCMDENTCHFMQSANTNSVCVECCNNDFCNKRGCGNTDFPAREQRGPVCFDCHHTGDPNTCDTVTMCTSNQVCSIEKFQWGDNFHYKQGCSHPVCNSLSRRRRSIPICHSCCNDDFCNRNCSSNAIDNSGVFVG